MLFMVTDAVLDTLNGKVETDKRVAVFAQQKPINSSLYQLYVSIRQFLSFPSLTNFEAYATA